MAGARSDKLYQRAKRSFARKPPAKPPNDRILIVCGDTVVEPTYFKALCDDIGLNSAAVKILGERCGDTPSAVFDYAKKELDKDGDYDRVYCVFDKDTHVCYAQTLLTIQQTPKYNEAKVIAINSVPCFEFWILLHFESTTSPFKNSAEVESRIKKKCPQYSKTKPQDLNAHLKDRTDDAIKHAKTVLETAQGDNPSTRIHILVSDLIEQSKK